MTTTTRGRYRKPRNRKPLALVAAAVIGALVLIGACSTDEPPAETDTATVTEEPETAKPVVDEPEPEPEFDELTADDVILTIKTLEQKCFGSAGCRVQFRVEAGWGLDLDPDVTYEVTYEIQGGDDPMTLTMEIEGEYYYTDEYERIGTPSSDAELVAVPTFVEARS